MERAEVGRLVLLADRDLRFVGALERSLRRQRFRPERVGEREACAAAIRRVRPDAVVFAWRDGWETPFDVLRAVRPWSDAILVVLLRDGGVADELRCFRLGADDVVRLPASPQVVTVRLSRLLRPQDGDGERLLRRLGPLEVDAYSGGVRVRGSELALTPVEYRLLLALSVTPGRAFSRAELIEAAAPESDALERSVDVHVCNLRRKLAEAGAAGLLQTVRGVGYRLSGDHPRP